MHHKIFFMKLAVGGLNDFKTGMRTRKRLVNCNCTCMKMWVYFLFASNVWGESKAYFVLLSSSLSEVLWTSRVLCYLGLGYTKYPTIYAEYEEEATCYYHDILLLYI